MIQIAIDGACRGNGTVGCVSGSGVVINHDGVWLTRDCIEEYSTNQRGELYALMLALHYCAEHQDGHSQIITDSEYLLNTINKEWYKSWISRGWLTSKLEPVKNKDLWEEIVDLYEQCDPAPQLYYIKGHLVPDGGKNALLLLYRGPQALFNYYHAKFDACAIKKAEEFEAAQELSVQNNGFKLPDEIFKTFVALNGVADRIAVRTLIK